MCLQTIQKKFTLTTYGSYGFNNIKGFEQVITNGIPTYYVADGKRVVQFDQYWNYQKSYNLTDLNRYGDSYSLKYVNGFFNNIKYNIFYKLT